MLARLRVRVSVILTACEMRVCYVPMPANQVSQLHMTLSFLPNVPLTF